MSQFMRKYKQFLAGDAPKPDEDNSNQ